MDSRGRKPIGGVQTCMRLMTLVFTAVLAAASARAQELQPSSPADKSTPAATDSRATAGQTPNLNLPVSLDRIKEALQQPPSQLSLRTLDEGPTFRMQILERQKIEELLATLNFKGSPAPAGGLYGYEQQRQMFPAVDNPLRQPYAAFNQGELLTILIENLMGKYLGGKAINAISNAERAHAEAAAKEEVRAAVTQYCAAQPNAGAGIQICGSTIR